MDWQKLMIEKRKIKNMTREECAKFLIGQYNINILKGKITTGRKFYKCADMLRKSVDEVKISCAGGDQFNPPTRNGYIDPGTGNFVHSDGHVTPRPFPEFPECN